MRKCRGFAINFYDDIVIYSQNIDDHFKHVRAVMLALKEFGFKISAEKSKWFAKEVSLLGYIVSGKIIRINPDKIATIRDRPQLVNIKQLQSALGCFNFYRRFINNFADKSRVLYRLLEKGVKFNWTGECSEAYKYFVLCITSEPAMAQPVMNKPFIVYSDGSKYPIGGVLCQEIDGVEHIIEYASRLLKNAELNYGISDIECLAVVFLVKKCHIYLYNTTFTLYTDHKAVLQLMFLKNYIGRLGRQALMLQEYTFTIKYLPGPENTAADISSRLHQYALAVTRSDAQREELIIQDDLSFKSENVDTYDDAPLMFWLINGKHANGISKKQVTRINKIKRILD